MSTMSSMTTDRWGGRPSYTLRTHEATRPAIAAPVPTDHLQSPAQQCLLVGSLSPHLCIPGARHPRRPGRTGTTTTTGATVVFTRAPTASEVLRRCPTAHEHTHRHTLRPVFWLLNVGRHLQTPPPLLPPQAQRRCPAGRPHKTERSPSVAHATFCFRGSLFLPVSFAPAGSAPSPGPPPSRAAPRSPLLGCPGVAPAPRHPQGHPASCSLCRDPQGPGAALTRVPPPVRAPGPRLSAPNSVHGRHLRRVRPQAARSPVPRRH
ncbi:hypothetical protein NDU88_003643 [Pleurodeles waltl]|uniref:Uncharacterized protein n=1 Tax=Pleurodeles waltl TaxID=8319 RepID=A0AAV7WPM8_PLEWA|nr:hypothetical protein NDU88_003643 [Pleurodeles waltl]